MDPTGATRSRTLLRAPIASESERAHFQRRLAFTLLVVFILSFGFWLVTFGVNLFLGHKPVSATFTGKVNAAHLATAFSALAGWVLLRVRTWAVTELDVMDAAATTLICAGWIYMGTCNLPVGRPELVSLLALSYTLVTRAAFVPSTPLRSAVIAAAGMLPLVPATYRLYASETTLPDPNAPFGPSIYIAIWAALGVTCTTTISYVIYGLRLQVRKAMQLGQYLLETKIGEGGMGVVYRASHAMLRRPTAVKLLTGTTGSAIERFEREVQLTARLTHPNTIAVFDYGRTPDGVFYYAMEYLDGITLDELVDLYGPQPPARVVHLLLQVCGALEEAHSAGLVHRDIKPANVMLTERGGVKDIVKVLDFGLVKESTEVTTQLSTSSLNAVMGTPHFMAPEAILDPPSVDGRADLYALAVTAYFLLTGERVFEGSNLVEICSAHLHQEPAAPSIRQPEVPAALDAIILACLSKKPEERPKDAAALAEQLVACNLPQWTRAEANAWWEKASKLEGRAPKRSTRMSCHPGGATMTVALHDRGDLAAG